MYHTAMKEKDIEVIIADMKAAGCSNADTDKGRSMHEAGLDAEILHCLRKCRCAMIDELHDKQRNVDRIDRLIRSADAMNTNR